MELFKKSIDSNSNDENEAKREVDDLEMQNEGKRQVGEPEEENDEKRDVGDALEHNEGKRAFDENSNEDEGQRILRALEVSSISFHKSTNKPGGRMLHYS